jgi:hypothetical protein
MARLVKCVHCEKTINRDIDEFVQTPQKRYAHMDCNLTHQKDQIQRKELELYMRELLGDNINFGMLNKQIKTYQDDYGFTISGILGTIHYIISVEGLSFAKSQGIGLVPYYYNKAKIYWARIKAANQSTQDVDFKLLKREIHINPPQPKPLAKRKFQTLSELEDEINGI